MKKVIDWFYMILSGALGLVALALVPMILLTEDLEWSKRIFGAAFFLLASIGNWFFIRIIYSSKRRPVKRRSAKLPVRLAGTAINVDSKSLRKWLINHPHEAECKLEGVMPLSEKEPVIALYEDKVKTREYRLQTENDENFSGKYFHICVWISNPFGLMMPMMQIDGFLSDTKKERLMTSSDLGYRMEGHFLSCGGENAQKRREQIRGQDLPMKGLKYPGYTTPSNVRLIGICPDCEKSFCFHGYAFYMVQEDVAYSDDGLDCCRITAKNVNKNDWNCTVDGKTFRYFNSFCCPHCGTPYIDYRKYPETKKFGVSGCVHLGRTAYCDTDASR